MASYTFLKALLFAALASPIVALGCGAKVAIDTDGGLVAVGGAGSGGATGSGAGSGAGGEGGKACVLPSGNGGPGKSQVTACFAMPEAGCPNQYDAVMHIVPSSTCVYLVSVDCGPVLVGSQCCYKVTEEPKPC